MRRAEGITRLGLCLFVVAVASFFAATSLRAQGFTIPDSGATSQWAKIGTFGALQAGETIRIVEYIHQSKDKRNKRHVGSIRPAFDRFPGRITASYTRIMSTSQRELPRSADFFRGGRELASSSVTSQLPT